MRTDDHRNDDDPPSTTTDDLSSGTTTTTSVALPTKMTTASGIQSTSPLNSGPTNSTATMIRNRPTTTITRHDDHEEEHHDDDVESPRLTLSSSNPVHYRHSTTTTTSHHHVDDDDDDDTHRPPRPAVVLSNHHHHHHRPQLPTQQLQRRRYPIREMQWCIRGLQEPVVMNPMVSLLAIVVLWSVVIWTIVNPEHSLQILLNLRASISLHFTWLFIGGKAFFFFFLIYIFVRYGHIKLGKKDDEPDFSVLTYSCMIFATGVASGFFVFAVAEPLFHQSSNFFTNTQYRSQDEIDMMAINLTVNNWAITGWTGYTIVAVCMSLATHRYHLPFLVRSCFYPILHHYTWGWIGDVIDSMTIVVSIGGISTSLGLGAAEILTGLIHLGFVDEYIRIDQKTSIQITTTFVIIIMCTTSVVSGIHGGIRLLSLFACAVGSAMLCVILLLDDTKFLLNLVVQEFGYFIQTSIFQLNFWTDAFGQLREGSGRAIDNKASEDWWMDAWTVFYVGWWISWAGFVGLMVARISRGRTLRELIFHTLILPMIICLVWFSVWGGIGLRQSRQGLELQTLGSTYFNDTGYFSVPDNEYCYNVPQENVEVNGNVIFTNYLPGVTPVCQFDASQSSSASFNVLYSFSFPESFNNGGFGPTLAVVYILALTLFFVTSSDSGSLIVDHLASNGSGSHHHWLRRLFWSFTQGALCMALLSSGGATALKAVQAMSILCGLPFIILMIFMVQSTLMFCRDADVPQENSDYNFPCQPEFVMPIYGGMFNLIEYTFSLGNVNKERVELGMDRPLKKHAAEFIKGVLVPSVSVYQIVAAMNPRNRNTNFIIAFLYALPYYGWIALYTIPGSRAGFQVLIWILFASCGTILGTLRVVFRGHYSNIRSNYAADFCTGLLLWPQVLSQMRLHAAMIQSQTKIKADDDAMPQPWEQDELSDSLSPPPSVQHQVSAP